MLLVKAILDRNAGVIDDDHFFQEMRRSMIQYRVDGSHEDGKGFIVKNDDNTCSWQVHRFVARVQLLTRIRPDFRLVAVQG
mmetsp:Transcript_27310/g.59353  ORF Transcript_27310/g.59353 Transcript_27310/m.59353 type:complete len:81 (+) Transcript_27310:978-1220(+)